MNIAIRLLILCKPGLLSIALILAAVLPAGAESHALTEPVAQEFAIEEITVLGKESEAKEPNGKLVQTMDSSFFQTLPFLQAADALKFFSGVSVKDYGGLGGLKTISVRSLGAHHTALSYDGLPVTDVQNGQIDLGRFALDALESISLNTGQTEDIFQPARLFASAGLLQLQSLKPRFVRDKKQNLSLRLQSGSFGLLNPSLLLQHKINHQHSLSLYVYYLQSRGDYPYLMHYGSDEDLISRERRQNSDISQLGIEPSWYWRNTKGSEATVKLYYNQSERGLPGAGIFYNTENYSNQRLWDRNAFVQGQYKSLLHPHWSLRLNTKINSNLTRYLDPAYLSSDGRDETEYRQAESYLSGALQYKPGSVYSLVFSQDLSLQELLSDEVITGRPRRLSFYTVLAGKVSAGAWHLSGNLLLSRIIEETGADPKGLAYSKLTPSLSVSLRPLIEYRWYLRAFYKSIFRMPSFNDLYYGRIGNPDLIPENTRQLNFGTSLSITPPFGRELNLNLDVYANRVENKIVAYPTQNVFVWTMLNLGEVSIKGLDLSLDWDCSLNKDITLALKARYTLQSVLNVTDPESRAYGHQIPYTPKHSGSGIVFLQAYDWQFSYNLLYSGIRYSGFENYALNRMPAYTDQGISLIRSFTLARTKMTLGAEVLNLTGKQYEIIRNYPMPGRSFRAKIIFNW